MRTSLRFLTAAALALAWACSVHPKTGPRLDRNLLADGSGDDEEGHVELARAHDLERAERVETGQRVIAEDDVPRAARKRRLHRGSALHPRDSA